MTHNDLMRSLADHLRATRDRVVWTDMQIGPAGSPRPDVYTIGKSFARFAPLAYEIKVSVADFRRDVTAGKWRAYLAYACGVTFAAPAGLITRADVPTGCGLMLLGDSGWRTIKAPTLQHLQTLERSAWLKLVIDGIARQVDRSDSTPARAANPWKVASSLRKRYGDELAAALSERDTAIFRLHAERDAANRQADSIIASRQEAERLRDVARKGEIDRARSDLAEALGLPRDAKIWTIQGAARDAADRLSRDGEIAHLRARLDAISRALAEATLPAIALPLTEVSA
ncbi:MAG: MmcB family DNA repair protein [Rhodocyclaceae bacterium]|nr:MmcB family DNA repair protein [Rhodocyclaceae bacterium]